MTAEPAAVLLRCAHCGAELPSLGHDRVWACAPCGVAYDVEGGRLAPHPYRAWESPESPALVWLPFWRVAYRAEAEAPDPETLRAVESVAVRGRAWVRAWWLSGAFTIGDPGQALTEACPEDRAGDGPRPVVAGACATSADAVRLAESFLLAEADRERDITGVTLRLRDVETSLVAFPYLDAGRDVVQCADGRTFRKAAIPNLAAIVTAQRRSGTA